MTEELKVGQSVREVELNGKKVREITMGGRVFLKEFYNSKGNHVMTESYSVDYDSMKSFVIQRSYLYNGKSRFSKKIKTYSSPTDVKPEVEYQYKESTN